MQLCVQLSITHARFDKFPPLESCLSRHLFKLLTLFREVIISHTVSRRLAWQK